MRKMKSQNGIVTLVVLISVVFLVSFLVSSYVLISNKLKNQQELVSETKRIYAGTQTMEEIYNSIYNNIYADNIYIENIVTEKIGGKEYIAPIPVGYVASKATGESTISGGLVIYEGTTEVNDSNVEQARLTRNQFVWIPVASKDMKVATYDNPYVREVYFKEPKEVTSIDSTTTYGYDTQEELNYYYGYKDEESMIPYYNYATDFTYNTHYAEMATSVNKYGGFYIGRYETTIDSDGEIGSKYNTNVLTAGTQMEDEIHYYRWWGLYDAQRKINIAGNGTYIQTNMIWGQQWDKMIAYFDSKSIDYSEFGTSTQGGIVNSGQSTNSSGNKDILYNIYDLRTNGYDFTAETAYNNGTRNGRGGMYNLSKSAYDGNNGYVFGTLIYRSTRATLYIK